MSVLWRETKDVMSSQVNGNIKQTTTTTTIQNPTSIHKSNSYPKPTTLQNQRQSKTNLYSNTNDQSTTPIQRSLDCHLIKAFVAHPIMGYTCCTPASNYLLRRQRQNRHANIMGRGLDPPGSQQL